MRFLKSSGAAALSLVVLSGAGVAAGATTTVAAASGLAGVITQKLLANNDYPYTQVTLSLPHVSGKGVSAEAATIASGIKLVVAEVKTAKAGQSTLAQVDIYYKTVDLATVRIVGGNLYLYLDVTKWSALPIKVSASTRQALSGVEAAFGNRWIEISAADIKQLEKKLSGKAGTSSVINNLTNPQQLTTLAATELPQLLKGLTLSESTIAGGNLSFKASGSLQAIAANVATLEAGIEKATHQKVAPIKSLPTNGTFAVQMSTAAAGAYIANVAVSISSPGKAALTLALGFTHHVEPITAPTGATLIPSSTFASL